MARAGRSGRGWGLPAAVGAVLVAANVVNNRVLPDRDGAYVASCLGTAGTLVALARADGRTWDDLGMARRHVGAGARWGAVGAAAVAAAGAATMASATGRAALRDERAASRGTAGAMRAALIRVPLGTVALEEVAFRSVLPAVLTPRLGPGRATAVTAAAFGAWHVLPSRDLHTDNQAAAGTLGSQRATVAAAVTSTAVAHLGFALLRSRSSSVVAPALVHWASNGLGYLAAAATAGRAGARPRSPSRAPSSSAGPAPG